MIGTKIKAWIAGWPGAMAAVWIVALDAVLIYYRHYFPYDRLMNFGALAAGARPAMVFGLCVVIEVLSLALFGRLLVAMVPSGTERRRWLTGLVGAPLALACAGAFDYAFVSSMEAGGSAPWSWPAGAALALAVALAGFITVGRCEGSGTSGRDRVRLFLRVLLWSVVMVPFAIVLRWWSVLLLVLPGVGPVAAAAFNLGQELALVRAAAARGRTDEQLRRSGPGPVVALLSGLATFFLVGLAVFFPGPARDLAATPLPRVVTRPDRVSFAYEDRDSKKIAATEDLWVMVGKSPFSIDVFDDSDRAVFRLAQGPQYADAYQGVAVSRELRAVTFFPGAGPGRLYSSRAALDASPLWSADSIERRAGEIVVRGRAGSRPVAVIVSFPDNEIVRVRVEGPSSDFHTLSLSFKVGRDERFGGLGGDADGFDRRGRDLDLLIGDPAQGDGFAGWRSRSGRFKLEAGRYDMTWAAPLVYLSRGAAVLLGEGSDPRFELASRYDDAARVSARGGLLELYVITGRDPGRVMENYAWLTGPRRTPPASVVLPWSVLDGPAAGAGRRLEDLTAGLRRLSIPCENIAFSEEILDPGRVMAGKVPADLIASLLSGRDRGFRFLYRDAAELTRGGPGYEEAVAAGVLIKNRLGLPYHYWRAGKSRVLLDFTNPETGSFRRPGWEAFRAAGLEGVALDPRALPMPDALLYNGWSGLALRNIYPMIYAGVVGETLGRDALITADRGSAGLDQYVTVLGPAPAGGGVGIAPDDAGAVRMINLGLSGAPLTGPDPSGLGLALGYASPVMTVPGREIQEGPAGSGDQARDLAERHSRLFPYLYTLAREQALVGRPAVRGSMMSETGDWSWPPGSYFLGPSLLVALAGPPGGVREVLFPPGRWLRLDNYTFYPAGRREVVFSGAPLLFLGEGSLLVVGDGFDTLSPASVAGVRVGSLEADYSVLWIAGRPAELTLFDGARLSARAEGRQLWFAAAGGSRRSYTLVIYDCAPVLAMYLNGVRLDDSFYTYQERARLLTVTLPAGSDLRLEAALEREK